MIERSSRIAVRAMMIAVTALAVPQPLHALMHPAPLSADDVLHKHFAKAAGVSQQGDFEATFLRLDHDNQRLFDGLDVLDYDPVCQCQDTGGAYQVSGRSDGADRYIATVRMTGAPRSWQVIMRKVAGAWKFYDVIEARGSIRALLARHNACARARRARGQSVDRCATLK
jgi:hypothetical protein